MLVCKRSSNGSREPRRSAPESTDRRHGHRSRLGEGGPVFLPRRKPSAIAEALVAGAPDAGPVTAYDDLWFAGRPAL